MYLFDFISNNKNIFLPIRLCEGKPDCNDNILYILITMIRKICYVMSNHCNLLLKILIEHIETYKKYKNKVLSER